MDKERKYARGRWPRKQLYAIVLSYRLDDRDSEWVSKKLGISQAFVNQIYEYGAEMESFARQQASLDAAFDRAVVKPNA